VGDARAFSMQGGILLGSVTIQDQLWGARAQDWAAYVEQVCLSLFGAALDAAFATRRYPAASGSVVRTWSAGGRGRGRLSLRLAEHRGLVAW